MPSVLAVLRLMNSLTSWPAGPAGRQCSLCHHEVPVQVGHVPPSTSIVTTVFATKYVPK
jgi:hypothetical protein